MCIYICIYIYMYIYIYIYTSKCLADFQTCDYFRTTVDCVVDMQGKPVVQELVFTNF